MPEVSRASSLAAQFHDGSVEPGSGYSTMRSTASPQHEPMTPKASGGTGVGI
jgi:hypothetical protein